MHAYGERMKPYKKHDEMETNEKSGRRLVFISLKIQGTKEHFEESTSIYLTKL